MSAQIQKLETILAAPFSAVKVPLEVVMPGKENQWKYATDPDGNITGLNLARTRLTSAKWDQILAAFPTLPDTLQVLNLCENDLTKMDFSGGFNNLRELNLAENKGLGKITFAAPLPGLERLDASECRLSDFVLPEGFQNLRWLDLRKTGLAKISFAACPALEAMDLSQNKLASFRLPAGFGALKYLFLNENQVQSLDFQADLPNLQILNLQNNQLPAIGKGFLDNFPNLQFLQIKNNPVTSALSGFTEEEPNNLASVQRFLREIADGTDIDNECKILLIGNGNVGKSCLVERLVNNRFVEEWCSTHAISLASYDLNEYRLNLWDFGGQDIYHATHRLFMQSEAVYLLLWDLETENSKSISRTEAGEIRTYDHHPLSYWLDYAYFIGGKNCPVMVVQTKMLKQGHEKQEPPGNIRQKYRGRFEFLEFENIDSKENDWDENGFNELILTLKKAIKRVQPKKIIPLKYAEMRRHLRELQQSGRLEMDMDEYLAEAKRLKIESPELVLENWLTKTGVVYFKKGLFKNKIILNQEVAIKAIYTLFDREGMYHKLLKSEKGAFSGKDLATYWKDLTDHEAERELFVSFMLSCEMCFETTPKTDNYRHVPFAERTFVAPQLLPAEKPKTVEIVERNWKNRTDMLHLKFHHEFLHYGIIQSFIVRTQQLANTDDIWKNGILLLENEENAIIEAGKKEIRVSTAAAGRVLFQKIRNLLRTLEDSPSAEAVSHDGQHFVALEKLKNHPAANPQIETLDGKYVEVKPFQPFLNLDDKLSFEKEADEKSEMEKIMSDKMEDNNPAAPAKSKKPKIFISYSHKDEKYKDKLVNHLSSLKNQKLIEAWQDRSIEAGEWDPQIQKAMEEADIFLLMITDNFLASKYITEREITTAYQKYKAGKAKIFPVIVDACLWQDQPVTELEVEMHPVEKREKLVWLGKFQPFPTDGKPIKNWKNKNDAFLKVIESLKAEVLKMNP